MITLESIESSFLTFILPPILFILHKHTFISLKKNILGGYNAARGLISRDFVTIWVKSKSHGVSKSDIFGEM